MNSNQHPRRKVTINEHCVELFIDSGSNVNIIDRSTFDRICGDLTLEPVRKDIRAYASNEPLPIIGRVSTKVTSGSNTMSAHFYVVDGRQGRRLEATRRARNLVSYTLPMPSRRKLSRMSLILNTLNCLKVLGK